MPHLAAAIGLVESDVRAFVDGKPCRFTGEARLDVGIGERAIAGGETRRSAASIRMTLDVFTAAIPEGERRAARWVLMWETIALHRQNGTRPTDAALEVARELGIEWED